MQSKLIILSQGPHHVAVFKPHNIFVVGGRGVVRPTLLDLVRKIFGKSIHPVHRLDRVTAGITIFARSPFAKHAMDNAFKKRLVKKTYYAVCEGKANFQKMTINQPLKKQDLNPKKSGPLAKQVIDEKGESAITHVRKIEQINDQFCIIEANPISGRMHQIRCHLAHIGLPVVGDRLYGAKTSCPPQTIALCAVGLSLPMPKGDRLEIDARGLFDAKSYLS